MSPYNIVISILSNSALACHVKSISPIQENSIQKGYDENDNNNMSDETKRETNYSINKKSGTTRATSTSPSTTPMTMLTSTIAWCTPCVERARRAHSSTLDVVSHLSGSSPESFHIHPWSSSWRTLFDSLLPFYFHLFFPVFSFYLLHSELYSELDNPIVMESLCYSANKESEVASDVSTFLTGFEPNFMTFGELKDSSGPFSYIIPSSDQDADDVTPGQAALRGTLRTSRLLRTRRHVSQSVVVVCCVRWIRAT